MGYGGMAAILLSLMLVYFLDPRLHRWFRIGPISIQPSEFAKPVLVLFLAHFAARRAAAINTGARSSAPRSSWASWRHGDGGGSRYGGGDCRLGGHGSAGGRSGVAVRGGAGAILLVFVTIAILTKPYRIARIFGYLDPSTRRSIPRWSGISTRRAA